MRQVSGTTLGYYSDPASPWGTIRIPRGRSSVLVERFHGMEEVTSSSLVASTPRKRLSLQGLGRFSLYPTSAANNHAVSPAPWNSSHLTSPASPRCVENA